MKPSLIVATVSLGLIFIILIIAICSCKRESFAEKHVSEAKGREYTLSSKFTSLEWDNIRKGQKIMTDMLRCFDRICRDNNLEYWAIGGTLIGAIRHNGWIPWDGDVDVAMTDKDLERFHEIAASELPPEYFTVNSRLDSDLEGGVNTGGTGGIDKVRYKYGRYSDWDPKDRHHGLQLDIFCVDTDADGNWISERHDINPGQDIIFPLRDHTFENILIRIPNNYNSFFQSWLGEPYPSILGVEKRLPHEGRIAFDVPELWKERYPELYP